jgi:hypothetical protein
MADIRSALVIATDAYQDPGLSQLRSPVYDAAAIANVLGDPSIGGFDVRVNANQPEAAVRRDIGRFFADRGRDELLLLYISCHGVKDESGRLYLAATDSELPNLAATATSAEFIRDQMDLCRSRAVVLILDCCYSGAFSRGLNTKSTAAMDLGERLGGLGRVVITSSTATEYAFEDSEPVEQVGISSIFSRAFVQGLATGEADLDQDGQVTVDELYDYLFDAVRAATPHQTPSKHAQDISGRIIIARNPGLKAPAGSPNGTSRLPADVLDQLNSDRVVLRLEVVERLTDLARAADPALASAARDALRRLAEQDDSRRVRTIAGDALAALPPVAQVDTKAPASAEPGDEADADQVGEYAPEPVASNDYWTTGDQLEYAPYAIAISEFIRHEATVPPLTIGIKAPWGAGKTSLMRMVQDRLDPTTTGKSAAGPESRRRIRLSPRSRRLLAPNPRRWWSRRSSGGPERAASPDVTNRTVLRKLEESGNGNANDLEIEPPKLEGWRPTVWFNPWKYQSGEQIWAGLAYEVITQVTDRMHRADREAFWLELNMSRVDADAVRRRMHKALLERLLPLAFVLGATVLVATVVAICRSLVPGATALLTSGAQALLAGGTAATVIAGVARAASFWREHVAGSLTTLVRPPDYTQRLAPLAARQSVGMFADTVADPAYESQLGQLHHVQTDMRRVLDLVATDEQPVVIFVDDLDRCSPSTVAQVIEAINLFLAGQFPNCVFVVAMEPEMIAAHIEVAYQPLVEALTDDDYWGEVRTLGWRFLDKIIQLPISLPALRSDQANEFLGATLVDRFRPTAAGARDGAVDEREVGRIAEGIRRRQPSIEDISEAAAAAQEERQGVVAGSRFSPETRAAMRQELRRRLRPDDPEVAEVVTAVAGTLGKNPREIKRFVNVFRFYAVIRQERIAAGLPAPDTLAEVAKLAVLAIRWPHLRAALGRQIGATERDTVLSLLEAPVAELPEDADWTARKEALHQSLADAHVPDRLRANLLASEDLCKLLATNPSIGTTAAIFL